MAKRLIDAEAAKKLAEEFYPFVEGCAEVRDVKDFLNCCSTIEAKPVVHAHWIELFDGENPTYSCSNCMNEQWRTFDFCPCCGAKMDEVVE